MNKFYINDILDSEDGTLIETIITENDCEEVINDCIGLYHEAKFYDTIQECLKNYNEYNGKIIEFLYNKQLLDKNIEYICCGGIDLIRQVLNYYEQIIENYEIKHIKY